MKARKTLIAVAVATLIPLGAAVAGDNDQYGNKDKSMSHTSFSKLDTHKDGKISQAEAAADSTIMFSTADTNGDGYLDKDELKASAKSGSTGNQPQSMPSSSSDSSVDSTQPQGTEPSGKPAPDTETPRQ
jgi:Ca2+-binding EF-hand superfamily protein